MGYDDNNVNKNWTMVFLQLENTRKTWNTDFIIICQNFKANFLYFAFIWLVFLLSRNYWSSLDHA